MPPGASGIIRAQFLELGTEELIQYLASQKLALSEIIQQIFRTQMIDGEGLTGMNKEDLERNGVPAGVASKIMMRIPL